MRPPAPLQSLLCGGYCFTRVCLWIPRTYADKLSPKVVQSLLDLLCSQLKNLLSQAAVNLLSSGSDRDSKKQEEGGDTEKKDIRGDLKRFPGDLFLGRCMMLTLVPQL